MADLPEAVAGDAVRCTDGSAMPDAAARPSGLEHHGLNTLWGKRRFGAWHTRNVNACRSRIKGWPQRFRGVAIPYFISSSLVTNCSSFRGRPLAGPESVSVRREPDSGFAPSGRPGMTKFLSLMQ